MTNRIMLIAIIIAIGTVSFITAQTTGKNLTRMSNDGANIIWTIHKANDGGTLTVSTPSGDVLRYQFKSGGSPIFSVSDQIAGAILDGQYRFEIVLTPILSESVKAALRAARAENRSEEVYDNFIKSGIIPPPMIDTGAFRVLNGLIYTADSGPEPGTEKFAKPGQPVDTDRKNPSGNVNRGDVPPENVQVINDDLVVLGSECIGLDCTTAPSFGFDTLRLSENNLRINFADTSSTSSFPTADWRIVANDTSNGGASYLAFEDTDAGTQPFRVEAGAGNAALWVTDSGGNVGMGTTTPVVELHITDGDTPTVRLEQNGASGFTPQTWDVAGNEAGFFVRDVTNGSQLPFRILPGADSESLVIDGSNEVGIGVGLNPSQKLEVGGNIQVSNNGSLIMQTGSTGGITFADGTIQTTAAIGTGFGETNTASNVGAGQGVFRQKVGVDLQFKSLVAGANVSITPTGADQITIASSSAPPIGASYATTIFGGSGTYIPANSTVAPVLDTNSYGTGINTAGYTTLLYDIPTNPNLVDPAGTNTVFRIRYRDSDGSAAAASVTVSKVTINTISGSRTTDLILSSNSDAGTGFQTLTVCKPGNYFDFAGLATHINVILFNGAATSVDLVFVQVYKSTTCP